MVSVNGRQVSGLTCKQVTTQGDTCHSNAAVLAALRLVQPVLQQCKTLIKVAVQLKTLHASNQNHHSCRLLQHSLPVCVVAFVHTDPLHSCITVFSSHRFFHQYACHILEQVVLLRLPLLV
jgi:hypothetical protein